MQRATGGHEDEQHRGERRQDDTCADGRPPAHCESPVRGPAVSARPAVVGSDYARAVRAAE
jgi:hypothetical protein